MTDSIYVCKCACACVSKHICVFLLLLWACCEKDRVKEEKKCRGQQKHGSLSLTCSVGEGSVGPSNWRWTAVLAFTGYLSAQSNAVNDGRSLAFMIKVCLLVSCSLSFSNLICKSQAQTIPYMIDFNQVNV